MRDNSADQNQQMWKGASPWIITFPGRSGCFFLSYNFATIDCLQKEAFVSPCNLATASLTACILHFCLPVTSRPVKWRTLWHPPNQRNRDAHNLSKCVSTKLVSAKVGLPGPHSAGQVWEKWENCGNSLGNSSKPPSPHPLPPFLEGLEAQILWTEKLWYPPKNLEKREKFWAPCPGASTCDMLVRCKFPSKYEVRARPIKWACLRGLREPQQLKL